LKPAKNGIGQEIKKVNARVGERIVNPCVFIFPGLGISNRNGLKYDLRHKTAADKTEKFTKYSMLAHFGALVLSAIYIDFF